MEHPKDEEKLNRLLFPAAYHDPNRTDAEIKCRERFRGLLKYYYREVA